LFLRSLRRQTKSDARPTARKITQTALAGAAQFRTIRRGIGESFPKRTVVAIAFPRQQSETSQNHI